MGQRPIRIIDRQSRNQIAIYFDYLPPAIHTIIHIESIQYTVKEVQLLLACIDRNIQFKEVIGWTVYV